MRRLLLYATMLLLTQYSKCKDAPQPKPQMDPTLPAETQTGANTFGFRLNGQVWRPMGGTFAGGNLSARISQNRLFINTERTSPAVAQYINIRLENPASGTQFFLDSPTSSATGNYILYTDDQSNCEYESNSGPVGLVVITKLDHAQRIVAGRFSFTLRRAGCPDVQATDGRFDLKF